MDLRLILAIFIGKLIAKLTKLAGGGATAAPGLYALKIDPNLVKKLGSKIKHGSIIVSGTNGKTTTARLAYDILSTKYKIIHNRQGSNLLRGIASELIKKSSLFGTLESDMAIWETDEAALPEAISQTSPKIVVLLNLFRDQLDRYGEVDTIRNKWLAAVKNLPQNTSLILNADDPGVSFLEKSSKGKSIFFGVNEREIDLPNISNVADIKHCLNCGSNLKFETVLSAHLGHYSCSNCNFKRPKPETSAQKLDFKPDLSTKAQLSILNSQFSISYNLPGLFNVYNILAAATVSSLLKSKSQEIVEKIESYSAAFGRNQKLKIDNKQIVILLIKNPTGANEVIRTIAKIPKAHLLVLLNDKIADGRDVSWIWDTNWEILEGKTKTISVGGIRCFDMALRLKYAGLKLSKNNIYKEINYSIINTLQKMNTKDTLIVLPTYTALLEVQKTLNQIGEKIIKWQHQ